MRIRHAVNLLPAILALALAACGKDPAPAEQTAATAPPAPAAEACKLNLFIWSEYIDPQIITDFETKYQCKVTIDLYEDNESMVAKLQGGGDSLYDVVVPGQYIIPVMVKLNLLAPLRKENIPNIANLDEKFASPSFDPSNTYSVAYQWGTVGVYWRKQPGKAVPRSWSIVFDKSQQAGSFLLMDSIREMMGTALKYKGYSVNSTDPAQLTEIRDLMRDAKQRSQGLEGGVGGKNKVLGKAVVTAIPTARRAPITIARAGFDAVNAVGRLYGEDTQIMSAQAFRRNGVLTWFVKLASISENGDEDEDLDDFDVEEDDDGDVVTIDDDDDQGEDLDDDGQ